MNLSILNHYLNLKSLFDYQAVFKNQMLEIFKLMNLSQKPYWLNIYLLERH